RRVSHVAAISLLRWFTGFETRESVSGRHRAELSGLIVDDRLANLFDRIHHEGTVGHDRLVDRRAMAEKKPRLADRFDIQRVAGQIELDEIMLGDLAAVDPDDSGDDVEEDIALMEAVEGDSRAIIGVDRRHEVAGERFYRARDAIPHTGDQVDSRFSVSGRN